MVSQKKTYLVLFVLVISALASRLLWLDSNPPGLNWDEVSHGYNAYSLLYTGRDQWSQTFPLFNFRAYGDYPTTLNLYMTVLPIFLQGPTDFALRFPHAAIGALTVLVGYIAACKWQKNRLLGLIVAFILAFSPWTFFLSRQVLQANWSIFLLTLGLALYFSKYIKTAILIWGLSLFAYHNTRIFVPLLLLHLLLQRRHRTNRSIVALTVGILILSGVVLWSSQSRARSGWVGIVDQGAVASIEEMRNNSALPAILARMVYNRPVYLLANTAGNYLGYFSPKFLFLSGGTQYQFSLPGFGVLNPVLLPFFYLGLYFLLRQKQWFILSWILLSPLPAAITRDQYAVVRATTMIPVVVMACALGVTNVMKYFKFRLVFLLLLVSLYMYFSYTYVHTYITKYPILYSQSWQYANKSMVKMAQQMFPQYDKIIISKIYAEPHEFILWYWPYHPAAYQTDPALKWDYHDNWYWVDGFSKFIFANDWEMADLVKSLTPGKKYLIFTSPENQVSGAKIGQIDFMDGKPAYIVTAI